MFPSLSTASVYICLKPILNLLSADAFISLPNDNILDCFQLKAFADGKLIVARIMISPCDRVENIVGKEENAGYQHFLFFQNVFRRLFPRGR